MRGTLLLLSTVTLFGADAQAILEQHCQRCHNSRTAMGNVSLATEAGVRKVIVPGKPGESRLIQMISGAKPKMPAGGPPLSQQDVASLGEWIAKGAPWAARGEQTWWSLRPLAKPAGGSLDSFIQAKLTEKGLHAAPEADRASLIRRLSYDLHGLPPSWGEVQAFVKDGSPDAYEKLVDRLLASPRYGERWGRHWLDVVHYGESHGYDKDKPRRNAWPYRDYVIRAFNEDKPYARFVEEQLAGDVLYPDSPEAIVATGFIAAGPWDFVGHVELREGTTDKKIARMLDRDDMVMTTMSAFVSTTAHCARCHNHKFDPIPQEDYYKLQAVFAGIDRADRPFDRDPAVWAKRRPLWEQRRAVMAELKPLLDSVAKLTSPQIEKLDDEVRLLKERFSETKDAALQPKIAQLGVDRKAMVQALVPERTKSETARLQAKLKSVDSELAGLPKPEWVYAAADFFDPQSAFTFPVAPRPITVLQRGSVDAPGKPVGPGALSCVPGLPSAFETGDRRAALAHWITAKQNMLTWRSIVNRVWQYHFGTGIVDSANDFGRMGAQPTHPELLDWLAATFRDGGGSIKHLQKLIVMSATYRQSAAHDAANAAIDADNRYLWRMNRRRLDAESLRDGVLAVTGKLDLTMGGPAVEQFWFKDDHSPVYDYTRFDIDSPASYRRSVYRFLVRSVADPFMDRLDCPDSSLITAKRNTTLTAIQALALLNNPFMVRQSEHLAARVRGLAADAPGQIGWLYRLAIGREARPSEVSRLAAFASQYGLENACRAVLNSNEFLFVE